MKTAELTGALLDYWVAKADGVTLVRRGEEGPEEPPMWHPTALDEDGEPLLFCPSRDWSVGGPIIERYHIELHCIDRNGVAMGQWMARAKARPLPLQFGPTTLIAAMRAKVASVYGETVEDMSS